ncbi:uncharacterized protein LOC6582096 [Drosophila mojavensis]|uniref:Uncharacterized protein n=1 Tax=Drosophila mojavensis TaxID=7230 RepID=B4KUX0_DROMO|nr:uncharacterized protein LOC6582096 [Drosophila mojavensis]EDW18281.1 uncharacterized protein Dmoj_GI12180 [Drosophila mojavensis]
MATERIQLKNIQSFMELTAEDQERCNALFKNEPLESKHIMNKYVKRTAQIMKRARPDPVDNECFLCFDIYPLNFKYSTVLCCLCGVMHQFYYVLYMNVIEDTKMEHLSQFMCDLLANLISAEIPLLTSFKLKFVLCRDNPINKNVLKLFSESETTSKIYTTYPFIRETNVLRQSQIHNPYVQLAWLEIMQGNIQQSNIHEIFQKHRDVANAKEDPVLKLFVEDFHNLAKDLLQSRFLVNLRLCTMERLDLFEQVIRAHLKTYKDRATTRLFLFELLRALLHIYDL